MLHLTIRRKQGGGEDEEQPPTPWLVHGRVAPLSPTCVSPAAQWGTPSHSTPGVHPKWCLHRRTGRRMPESLMVASNWTQPISKNRTEGWIVDCSNNDCYKAGRLT